ncbi:MAG: hypothetical protein ACLP2U_04950 [Syntrophobacteraceae bacterium]
MSPGNPEHDLEEAISPKNEADQNRDATPRSPEVVPKIPPTPTETDNPHASDKERKPWWLKGLEVIGALAIVVYAIFSGLQWYIMQSSMKLDQRAWIGSTIVKGLWGIGKPIDISVQFRNTGKTPAKNVATITICDTIEKNIAPSFDAESNIWNDQSRSVMTPQQVAFIEVHVHDDLQDVARDAIINDVLNGVKRAYVHGRVEYEDIFGKPHWLTFCYFYDPIAKGYRNYSQHNDTDNN